MLVFFFSIRAATLTDLACRCITKDFTVVSQSWSLYAAAVKLTVSCPSESLIVRAYCKPAITIHFAAPPTLIISTFSLFFFLKLQTLPQQFPHTAQICVERKDPLLTPSTCPLHATLFSVLRLESALALLCVSGAFRRFNRTQSLIHNPQTKPPGAMPSSPGLPTPNKGQGEKSWQIHGVWPSQLINLYGCHNKYCSLNANWSA